MHRVSMFITGTSESRVEEMVQPIYAGWRSETPPIETTILATPGQIELHLSLRSADATFAVDRLARARAQLVDRVGSGVFSLDGRVMEEIVGAQLLERGLTIAASESCTGGLFTSRLTDVPGSSAYVLGGVVAYSNDVKTNILGVPAELIAEHGAVSEPVASAMAQGIRARTGASIGVGITGVAGPAGGTAAKPVGMVAVAVAAADGSVQARTFNFPGGRAQVKFQAAQSALDMVRRLFQ
jgi:nicotinamide-nucleotide amidase